jgi:hypothetical protein
MKKEIIWPSLFVLNAFLVGMTPKTSKAGSINQINYQDSVSYSVVMDSNYLLPQRFGAQYVEMMPKLYKNTENNKDSVNNTNGVDESLSYDISWHGGSWVKYTASDGSGFIRTGGSRTWRNMNPGAIRPGKICDQYGACGSAGGFAVFPTEEQGMNALLGLLKSDKYANLTIAAAIYKYAPPSDHNDTRSYQQKLSKMTGLNLNKKLNQLTPSELDRVANAIKTIEGWRSGRYESFDVRRKTSNISPELMRLMKYKSMATRQYNA